MTYLVYRRFYFEKNITTILALICSGMMSLPLKAFAYDGARLSATDEEIDLMANVVMAEAGIESYECKVAVAETIVNRVLTEDPLFPDTITEIIYQENAYETEFDEEASQECFEAVYEALDNQTYGENIMYFRLGHYHSFAQACFQIDHTYFSM